MALTFNLIASLLLSSLVFAARYEQYILAPTSRTLHPASVYNVNGSVSDAESLTGNAPGSALFKGPSAVTYDFGKVDCSCRVEVRLHH